MYLISFLLNNKSISLIVRKVLIIVFLVILIIIKLPKQFVQLNIIDVGQGDAIHIVTCKGKSILIDGGGSEQSDYDVGEKVLIPYLLKNQCNKIDAIIVSHFHEDHAEGIIPVLSKLRVNRIIIGSQETKSSLYTRILEIAKEKHIQIITVKKGDSFSIDRIKFEVLYPPVESPIKNDLNNNSLIIRANIFDTKVLFTGDMENLEENFLISSYSKEKLDTDILKVGHHGSKTSTSEALLDIVRPNISVISCGVDNKFGHPHNEVLKRLEIRCKKIYRTDLNGEIMFKVYKNNVIKIKSCIE